MALYSLSAYLILPVGMVFYDLIELTLGRSRY